MDYKKTNAPGTTVTRDMMELCADTGNVYETVAIIGKRANQISVEIKNDLSKKLAEFAGGFINATDCADFLVSKGLPFRDAYKATGELVALCIKKGTTLEELPIDEYKSICPLFDEGVYDAINLENCVTRRGM